MKNKRKMLIVMAVILLITMACSFSGLGLEINTQAAAQAVVPTQASASVVTPTPADMASNDHGQPPQPQIGHPSFYVESGVSGKEYTWTLNVGPDEMGIVGGWSVDGKDNGTYRGFGPGKYTVRVIDGFALAIKSDWASNEWQFRLDQAEQYGWAHSNVDAGPIK